MPEENKETIQAALDRATRLNTKFKIATAAVGGGFGITMCSGYLLGLVPSAAALYLGYKWAGEDNIKQLSLVSALGSHVAGLTVGTVLALGMGLGDVIEYDFAANGLEQDSAYVQPAEERVAMNTNEIIVPKLKA